jgi:hypothetical protein
LKSQTWSEKHEQTSNFNVAELSRQESFVDLQVGNPRRDVVVSDGLKIFSCQYQHLQRKSKEKRQTWTKQHEED